MTGISLRDFKMKIESNINPNTMTSMKINTQRMLSVDAMLEYIFWTIHDTMDAKISNEVPFDTHFSVINSQIRISNTDQTVMTNAERTRVTASVGMTLPPRR